jgi:hypothetical protein
MLYNVVVTKETLEIPFKIIFCRKRILYFADSVAKGLKFRPQNTDKLLKNLVGPEKSGEEYFPDL